MERIYDAEDFEYLNAKTQKVIKTPLELYEIAIEALGLEEYYRLRYEEGLDHDGLREYLWENWLVDKKLIKDDEKDLELSRIRRTRLKEIEEFMRKERSRMIRGLGTVGYVFLKNSAIATDETRNVKFFEYEGLLAQYIRTLFNPADGDSAFSEQGIYQEIRSVKIMAEYKDCSKIREFLTNNPLDEVNICYEVPYTKIAMLLEDDKIKLI